MEHSKRQEGCHWPGGSSVQRLGDFRLDLRQVLTNQGCEFTADTLVADTALAHQRPDFLLMLLQNRRAPASSLQGEQILAAGLSFPHADGDLRCLHSFLERHQGGVRFAEQALYLVDGRPVAAGGQIDPLLDGGFRVAAQLGRELLPECVQGIAARREKFRRETAARVRQIGADYASVLVHAQLAVGVLIGGEGQVGGQGVGHQASGGVEQQRRQTRLGQNIKTRTGGGGAGLHRQQAAPQGQLHQLTAPFGLVGQSPRTGRKGWILIRVRDDRLEESGDGGIVDRAMYRQFVERRQIGALVRAQLVFQADEPQHVNTSRAVNAGRMRTCEKKLLARPRSSATCTEWINALCPPGMRTRASRRGVADSLFAAIPAGSS